MGEGTAGNRQSPVRRPAWKTDTMHWTLTHNTESRSVWTSGDYECIGYGRQYGQKLVRDWEICFRGKRLDTTSRLSEAKGVAERHRRDYVPAELTVFAVAIESHSFPGRPERLTSFHLSEESARKAADAYNSRYTVGPRAEVKPIEVQP